MLPNTANTDPHAGRQLLMARRSELISLLTGRPADTIAQIGRVAEDDQAAVFHDEFVTLETKRMAFEQLRLVDTALTLIATGEYGVCQNCEEAISPRRLRAVPWARYCIACEERPREPSELQPACNEER